MKIVLWGAGRTGNIVRERINKDSNLFAEDTFNLTDNDERLHGTVIDGFTVSAPRDVIENSVDLFVICSIYFSNIKEVLREYGIDEDRIIDYDSYFRRCYARYRYRQRYGVIKRSSDKAASTYYNKKIVVYTAIMGNYDKLNTPIFVDEGIDYVCFTDSKELQSEVWNIEEIHHNNLDPVMMARKIKLNPANYFKDYELSIWVDAKYLIKSSLQDYVEKYRKTEPVLCFPHPQRNCLYDEAATCISFRRGDKQKIVEQISYYYNDGFPFEGGLYETGCIVRWHNDDTVKTLMELWNNELDRFSYRDQISFPYICKKYGFLPDICDMDINNNTYLYMNRVL